MVKMTVRAPSLEPIASVGVEAPEGLVGIYGTASRVSSYELVTKSPAFFRRTVRFGTDVFENGRSKPEGHLLGIVIPNGSRELRRTRPSSLESQLLN
jgi:hypothetical protein